MIMKKESIIKSMAVLISAAMLSVSFYGCQKDSGSEENDSSSETTSVINSDETEQEIPDYRYDVTPIGTDKTFENIESIQYAGGKITVFEQPGGSFVKEYAQIIDVSSKQVREVNLSAIEYLSIQFMVMDNGKLYTAYADKDNNQRLCILDSVTGQITADVNVPEGESVSGLRADSEGGFTAIKSRYTEDGKDTYAVRFNSETLETVEEIKLSGDIISSDSVEVIELFRTDDGSYFVYAVDYGMDFKVMPHFYGIDKDGKAFFMRDDFENWDGYFVGTAIADNGNILLCATSDYIVYHVYEIDCKTGRTVSEKEMNTGKASTFFSGLSIPGYDLVYITSSAIMGYSFETQKSEAVVRFGSDLDSALNSAYNISSYNNELFLYNISYVDSGRTATVLDRNGKIMSDNELPVTKGYASKFCTASDGTIYYSETYDPFNDTETVSGYNMAYIFHVIDPSGKHTDTFTIDEIDNYGDAVISNLETDEEGNLYMCFQIFSTDGISSVLYKTDTHGKILNKFYDAEEVSVVGDIIFTEDKDYVIYQDQKGSVSAAELDYSNDSYKKTEITYDENATIIGGDSGYDFYYKTDEKIFGHSIAENKSKGVADFSSDDLSDIDVNEIYAISEDEFLCSTYNSETGESGVVMISKHS